MTIGLLIAFAALTSFDAFDRGSREQQPPDRRRGQRPPQRREHGADPARRRIARAGDRRRAVDVRPHADRQRPRLQVDVLAGRECDRAAPRARRAPLPGHHRARPSGSTGCTRGTAGPDDPGSSLPQHGVRAGRTCRSRARWSTRPRCPVFRLGAAPVRSVGISLRTDHGTTGARARPGAQLRQHAARRAPADRDHRRRDLHVQLRRFRQGAHLARGRQQSQARDRGGPSRVGPSQVLVNVAAARHDAAHADRDQRPRLANPPLQGRHMPMSRLRNEQGIALATTIILVAVMLVMGAAILEVVNTQAQQTSKDRAGESAFNLAEATLNSEAFLLGRNWPQASVGGTLRRQHAHRRPDGSGDGPVADADPAGPEHPRADLQRQRQPGGNHVACHRVRRGRAQRLGCEPAQRSRLRRPRSPPRRHAGCGSAPRPAWRVASGRSSASCRPAGSRCSRRTSRSSPARWARTSRRRPVRR